MKRTDWLGLQLAKEALWLILKLVKVVNQVSRLISIFTITAQERFKFIKQYNKIFKLWPSRDQ